MRRLAKNLILAAAVVSAIFIVDLSQAEAANFNETCVQGRTADEYFQSEYDVRYLDFWSKFRDTVMPDPDDEPQNNNPPKNEVDPKPEEPRPEKPPKVVTPKPANPPKVVTPKPAD